MHGWQVTPADGEAFRHEAFGILQFPLVFSQDAQCHHALSRLGAVWPIDRAAFFERQIQQRVGLIVLSQLFVAVSEFLIKLGLHGWVCIKIFGLLRATIEKGDYTKVVSRTGLLVAALEQVLHESLNVLCTSFLSEGGIARHGQTHGVKDHKSEDCQEYKCCCADGPSVASDVF